MAPIVYCTDCFQSRADIGVDEMHASVRRNKAERELMSAFIWQVIVLSVIQERDDRKELICVALARNLCRAVIEA